MSGFKPTAGDVDVDLGQLFGSLIRNWLRIAVVSLVVAGLALAYAISATPLYRAQAKLLIEVRESEFTRSSVATAEGDRSLLDEEGITSQVEVIRSGDILREVARSLDLAEREEFGGTGEVSSLGRLLVLFGLRSDPDQASVEERVVDAVRERLSVYRTERSRVIVIEFSSEDPQLAAAVPNAVAEAYIDVQRQAKLLSNENATGWLGPEIEELKVQVRDAEARVAEYRAQQDLMVGQNNDVLATQQLSELSSELTRVRASRAAAAANAAAIREALASGTTAGTLPEVVSAPLVQRLRENQAQLNAELADLSTTLLDNHPRMRSLRSQLAEVEQQIRVETEKVLESLENEAQAAQAREQALIGELNTMKAAVARANEDEVALRALEREAASQRALLETYMTRYREAESRAEANYLPVEARVFATANPPYSSYFPKVVPIVGAAFVASLLVMAVITLLQELFSGRAMRAAPNAVFEPVEEVAMPQAVLVAATVDEPAVVQHEPDPIQYEPAAVRDDVPLPVEVVVDEVEEEAAGDELTVEAAAERLIAHGAARAIFVSPEGDEATATSVMVAREVSDAGLRVLFLDLTFSGAPSSSMLESNRFPGITNLLVSEAQFSDIIRGDLYSDSHVIPVGTADAQRAMRAVERLPIIMESLTTAYDLVVVECGPTDAAGIARVTSDDSEVLISVIERGDSDVSATAANLSAGGYENVLKVTPVGHSRPTAPSGRSVA